LNNEILDFLETTIQKQEFIIATDEKGNGCSVSLLIVVDRLNSYLLVIGDGRC